jgi:alpha-D-xyloside xylohydrolase
MEVEEGEKNITIKSGWKDLSYLKTDWKGFAYDKGRGCHESQQRKA